MCRSCCACVCTLNQPASQTNCGTALTPIALTGIGRGTGGAPIVVTATSSNPALVANPTVTYTSPAATGTVPLTWGTGSGTATITITVSSAGCTPVSRAVLITVSTTARPPVFDPIAPVSFHFNGTVTVTGITASPDVALIGGSGSCWTGFNGSLTISAASSNPGVINTVPAPIYTSPNATATINLTGFALGTATITVTVQQTNIVNFGACCVQSSSRTFLATST
jgi:hypothetical protein